MKGNKIIATLVVLAMLLSTMVVLNQLNVIKQASAYTPGVNKWGNSTTDITCDVQYTHIYVNTSKWTGTGPWYLYYPTYRCDGNGNAYRFTWDKLKVYTDGSWHDVFVPNTVANSVALDTSAANIMFNRSGLWIFDNDGSHQGNVTSTYAGFLWVNTSTNYTINSVSDFAFGASGYKTFTVNTGSDSYCMIDILAPDNTTVYHKWRPGTTGEMKISGNFTMAGIYTIKAYRDTDAQNQTYYYPDEDGENYSIYYGSDYTGEFPSAPSTHVQYYNYGKMGPWDPPERNASDVTFEVTTGEPIITITNSTVYWGDKVRIDINVTDSSGKGIDVADAHSVIKLKKGSVYYSTAWINNTADTEGQKPGNYSLEIPRFSATVEGWRNLTANANGTWKIVFGYDITGSTQEEWNSSASFNVKSTNPPVRLTIVNDHSGKSTDKKVNVPDYTPGDDVAPTIDIDFDIFGRSLSGDRAYYGDQAWENEKNITIAGDILYPAVPEYVSDGRWTVAVTPTKPGGTFTLTIDWPGDDNGTASQTIEIVNGTNVVSAVDKFTVGADYNLTVTVTDMDGAPVKNANVYLMWENDAIGEFNHTSGNNKAGKGLNGEYTFWIKPHAKDSTHTPATAPQNITIAAQWYSHFWGYTKVVMEKNHNMVVNITPTTSYAGDSTDYDIGISLVGGGHPVTTGLTIALYNETGALVTGDDAWSNTGHYTLTDETLILSGGTYYIYAYNATHDSRGQNATLLISKYTVTSSPSVLAWKIDEAVNMTFQVSPNATGILTLLNMSSAPDAAIADETTDIDIENGIGTLDEVNATTLGNVTFEFTPEGGESRSAQGIVKVTTATATPSPATIYDGEATLVTITVTHPATGTPLKGVRVGLDHGLALNTTILAKLPTDQFTDAAGKVQFSITADASGNVTIYLKNETDPDNAFVIVATARKTMAITTDASVNEQNTFTVQAKDNNGILITGTTVTFTFAGQTWPTTTGVATLTAPAVSTSLTYTITATAEGYNSPSTTIMVINVPKLVIIPPSGEVKGKQKFTVTIANDEGAGVAGAAVTFNGGTFYSGANGICELTAPDVTETQATYPITATFTGYTSAAAVNQVILKTPSVPGFELLTLIAAIGVAFLLLRRRRN
jgi:hypothetical protein